MNINGFVFSYANCDSEVTTIQVAKCLVIQVSGMQFPLAINIFQYSEGVGSDDLDGTKQTLVYYCYTEYCRLNN